MRKVSESEKKLIATLRLSGQSIEYLKEKFKVAEIQINSYVKEYSDDETFQVSFKNKDKSTVTTNDKELLTEEYIMKRHHSLREYVQDVYETKAQFIKRRIQIPIISVNKIASQGFSYQLVGINDVVWGFIEEKNDRCICHPIYSEFSKGKLVYEVPKDRNHLDPKKLQQRGFKSNLTEKPQLIIYVTNPLKIYQDENLQLIKKGYYTLDTVLKENNLFNENQRSEIFTKFLKEQNYIK